MGDRAGKGPGAVAGTGGSCCTNQCLPMDNSADSTIGGRFGRLQDTERLRLRYTEEERAEIQDYAAQ